MPRKPLGDQPMTNAEKQRRRREQFRRMRDALARIKAETTDPASRQAATEALAESASRTFKHPIMQEHYDICRRLARDPESEFFVNGVPRLGAGHRVAYWKGRDGKPCMYPRDTPAYACWAAGVDDRADLGPPPAPVRYLFL